MTVETLDQMMTYVIEAWMLLSGTYLTIGFTTSLIQRMRAGNQAKSTAAVEESVAEEAPQADRLAEVAAVSEKYAKTVESETVTTSVSVQESN
ncbi:MAG: hypothetical protein AAGF01_15235 [Cyanobacteria bacterium P01_G01_bin.38]